MFERDADPKFRSELTDEEAYARLKPPTSIVVKFGRMKLIGEYPYRGDAKPGCGSKLVVRTFRAIEIAEMLTLTCSNSGCGKSVSRSEMLNYIENSGGREYPFQTNGEVLRVASVEDLNAATACNDKARTSLGRVREMAADHKFPAKIVDLELTLDESLLMVYYLCDERVDFRDLAESLAREFSCRIEMRQVGARDEARLVADYERCGQHCCCKNFLKVLKPISMRSAKIQKATLDPLKISGRCGRLMCCLRYEDATYEDLRKRLPKNKTRVGTAEGPGIVIDSKILVQLVLVRLDPPPGEDFGVYGREIAVPVEELMDPDKCPAAGSVQTPDAMRGMSSRTVKEKLAAERGSKLAKQDRFREKSESKDAAAPEGSSVASAGGRSDGGRSDGARPARADGGRPARADGARPATGVPALPGAAADGAAAIGDAPMKKKKRRKKRKPGTSAPDAAGSANTNPSVSNGVARIAKSDDGDDGDDSDHDSDQDSGGPTDGSQPGGGDGTKKKRRRRRRRSGPGGGPGGDGASGGGAGPTPSA